MRVLRLAAVCSLALFLFGCAATLPHQITANESYLTHPDAYTVLGKVEGTATMTAFLFFGFNGDVGYRAAMDDAMAKAQADGLINCVSDVTVSNMFFFRSIKTTIRALAIRRK